MEVVVEIQYFAAPDERLKLIPTDSPEIDMTESESGMWRATFETAAKTLSYSFILINSTGEIVRKEWGEPHRLTVQPTTELIFVKDHWHDRPKDAPLLSSAFTKVINGRKSTAADICDTGGDYLELSVECPRTSPEEVVAVAGSCKALGQWAPENAVTMSDASYPIWKVRIPRANVDDKFEYKFIIKSAHSTTNVVWEQGDNRQFQFPASGGSAVVTGMRFNDNTYSWRGSGTVIPVFSLRSERSYGIGDFADLKQMVDWVAYVGQNVLQILPINDTTTDGSRFDSYPYNAISTFALNPVYLSLDLLGKWEELPGAIKFIAKRRKLNSLSEVDYEAVFKAKMEIARLMFEHGGKADLESSKFAAFARENSYWLEAYVAFCVLRDVHGSPDWKQWGDYSDFSDDIAKKAVETNRDKADFYRYLQYHLDAQLKSAIKHARKHNVVLKGDIPIGVSLCGADTWQNPNLFNLDQCAGAPPDDFATDGQNWGFPTYNWEAMARDGYKWWKARLRKMAEYFDAYRIDHILGFFRIWQINRAQRSGLLGTFYPSLPFSPEEMKRQYGFLFDVNQTVDTHKPAASTDTLFITDPSDEHRFHPRIEGYNTEKFATLTEEQQEAYRKLHNDFFYHRHNDFWGVSAMSKLPPLIDCTRMLACGEDLGMIPACVHPTMDNLKILSLEVQRMPKIFGHKWGKPADYPYLSIATTSTHDMPGLRLWMEENSALAAELLLSIGIEPKGVEEAAPELCEAIIKDHLLSPSMFVILPWQDWMSVDRYLRRPDASAETINNPACSRHYWRYRMHLAIEQLLKNVDFNNHLHQLSALRNF